MQTVKFTSDLKGSSLLSDSLHFVSIWSTCDKSPILFYFFMHCLIHKSFPCISEGLQGFVFSQTRCCFFSPTCGKNQWDAWTNTALTINLGSLKSTCRCGADVLTCWPLNEPFCSELVHALWSKVLFLLFLSPNCPASSHGSPPLGW